MTESLSFRPGPDLGARIEIWRVGLDVPLSRSAACAVLLECGLFDEAVDYLAEASERPEVLKRRYVPKSLPFKAGPVDLDPGRSIQFQVRSYHARALDLWRKDFPIPPRRAEAAKFMIEAGARKLLPKAAALRGSRRARKVGKA